MSTRHRLCWLVVLVVLVGCASPDVASPDEPAPPAPPEVPLGGPAMALQARCAPLTEGERLLGAAADGAAWLATAEPSEVRVVLPDGTSRTLDLGMAPTLVRPSSAEAAALALGDRLFVVDAEGLHEVGWPAELGRVLDLCGDPSVDGAFVIAASGDEPAEVYRRAGGEWWRWRGAEGPFGAGLALVELAGACTAADDRAWLRVADGVVSLREDELRRDHEVGRVDALAIDPAVGIAALAEGRLRFRRGERWSETRFAAGAARALHGTAGALWVVAGERLHRYAAGRFVEATLALPGGVDTLRADPSGVWLVSGDSLCRGDAPDGLPLGGLRPFERRHERSAILRVGAAGALSVRVDGVVIHEDPRSAAGAELELRLGAPGWRRVEVALGERARALDVYVVDPRAPTWEDDIRPLYEAHCAGAACHGGDRDDPTRPGLASYDDWVSRANAIRNRVGVVADMPPPLARRDWSADDVTKVVAWIATGMDERREARDD